MAFCPAEILQGPPLNLQNFPSWRRTGPQSSDRDYPTTSVAPTKDCSKHYLAAHIITRVGSLSDEFIES